MRALKKHLKRFVREERGATAVEYGLILGLMTLAIIAAITSVGEATVDTFEAAGDGWM